MIQYGRKIEVKAMQCDKKKNMQGTNSDGKQIGTQINDLDRRKK